MRLVGASFAGARTETVDFAGLLKKAVQLLRGDGLGKQEAEALRETLIQGYRWILVDEYQDVGPEEYALIAAVAGRSLDDPDLRLSLFAVGDDDQNIYAFAGASIRYIRSSKRTIPPKPVFLTDNYRSTGHIIAAANAVIAESAETDENRARHHHRRGARTKPTRGRDRRAVDPVAQGRVQILDCPAGNDAQAMAALDELVRLSHLIPGWTWSRAAIISRDWRQLAPVRDFAEALGIPVEMANERLPRAVADARDANVHRCIANGSNPHGVGGRSDWTPE